MEINGNNSRQSYNKRNQITNTSRKNATHAVVPIVKSSLPVNERFRIYSLLFDNWTSKIYLFCKY